MLNSDLDFNYAIKEYLDILKLLSERLKNQLELIEMRLIDLVQSGILKERLSEYCSLKQQMYEIFDQIREQSEAINYYPNQPKDLMAYKKHNIIAIIEESAGAGPGWGWVYDPAKVIDTIEPYRCNSFTFATGHGTHDIVNVVIKSLDETSLSFTVNPIEDSKAFIYTNKLVSISINEVVGIATGHWHDASVDYLLGYWASMDDLRGYLENHDKKCNPPIGLIK